MCFVLAIVLNRDEELHVVRLEEVATKTEQRTITRLKVFAKAVQLFNVALMVVFICIPMFVFERTCIGKCSVDTVRWVKTAQSMILQLMAMMISAQELSESGRKAFNFLDRFGGKALTLILLVPVCFVQPYTWIQVGYGIWFIACGIVFSVIACATQPDHQSQHPTRKGSVAYQTSLAALKSLQFANYVIIAATAILLAVVSSISL